MVGAHRALHAELDEVERDGEADLRRASARPDQRGLEFRGLASARCTGSARIVRQVRSSGGLSVKTLGRELGRPCEDHLADVAVRDMEVDPVV